MRVISQVQLNLSTLRLKSKHMLGPEPEPADAADVVDVDAGAWQRTMATLRDDETLCGFRHYYHYATTSTLIILDTIERIREWVRWPVVGLTISGQ